MEEIRTDEWAGDARDISGRRRLAWSKNQRQNPITRAQTTALVTRLRDQTIPQLTAKLARRKLAEIQPGSAGSDHRRRSRGRAARQRPQRRAHRFPLRRPRPGPRLDLGAARHPVAGRGIGWGELRFATLHGLQRELAVVLADPLVRERALEPVQELRGRIDLVVVLARPDSRNLVSQLSCAGVMVVQTTGQGKNPDRGGCPF